MTDRPQIHFEVVTLFPELFDSYLQASLLGKAIGAGIVAVTRTNPRAFGLGRHKSVDDTPYGGGPGMILRVEPLAATIDDIEARRGRARRIILSPQGAVFNQAKAAALAKEPRVLLVCGRYEGFDERVLTLYADDVLSIGDYVLSGGETAAMVVIEAVSRLLPGVLGSSDSIDDESFSAGGLEYPQWTKPPEFRGLTVPPILLSGDHAAIARWRVDEARRRTGSIRPDLLALLPPVNAPSAKKRGKNS